MTKKKKDSMPASQEVPPGVSKEVLADGDWLFTIKRNRLTITCRFNPEDIKTEIDKLFSELFKMARTGEKPDYDVILDGTNIRAVVEVKSRNVKMLDGLSNEEVEEERSRYVDQAWRRFLDSFYLELYRLPADYLYELKTVTLAQLDPLSILQTKSGVIHLFNDYFKEKKRDFKLRYEAPGAGDAESTTPRQRAKLLKAHNKYYKLLKEVQKRSKPNKRQKGWKKEVKDMLGNINFSVVGRVNSRVKGNSPGVIATELATRECGMIVNTYTPKILRQARRESELAKKKRPDR
jgi:hypothetical protein